jgi:chromosome segregation ATPase
MISDDIAQTILSEIRRLGERMSGIETLMGVLKTRMDSLNIRINPLEAGMGSLESRVGSLETRAGAIETDLSELKQKIHSWPDMHFLNAAARAQHEHSQRVQTEIMDLKTKVDEFFGNMAAGSEIRVPRAEMSKYQGKSLETDLRLGRIERNLGIVHDLHLS